MILRDLTCLFFKSYFAVNCAASRTAIKEAEFYHLFAERTEKIPMGSIKNVISESIEGHEEYHIMVSLKSALQGVKSIFLNFSSLYCIVLWHDDSPIFPGEREILHLPQACFAPCHKEGEILHVKRGYFVLWLEEGGIFLFWRACFAL